MPDEIPEPPPSMPTKPVLTPQMLADNKAVNAPQPGAGGWTPKPQTPYVVGGAAAAFLALAVSLPPLLPGKVGGVLGAVFAALGGGCMYFATKSAGPRTPTE